MRNMRFKENTIKDLGTLNRAQSMLLNLYVKGYTNVTLAVFNNSVELSVYEPCPKSLDIAEIIIRNTMADGDVLGLEKHMNEHGVYSTLKWCGYLIETEDEDNNN